MGFSYGDTENSPQWVHRHREPDFRDAAHGLESDGTEAPEDDAPQKGGEEAPCPSPRSDQAKDDAQEEARPPGKGFGSREAAHGQVAPDAQTLDFWLRYARR